MFSVGRPFSERGYYEYLDGNVADLSLNGLPTLNIDYRSELSN